MIKLYLDNCCYNRPYDDQENFNVALETQCKIQIQDRIRAGKYSLVSSFILTYESDSSPYESRKASINQFITEFTKQYVGIEHRDYIEAEAYKIMQTGIKFKDACHVVCAILAKCDYFISTDKRLLKYQSSQIRLVNPIQFIIETEENENV